VSGAGEAVSVVPVFPVFLKLAGRRVLLVGGGPVASGKLAGLLREALETVIPEDVGTWVDQARRLRERQKAEGVPLSRRRPLLLDALNRLYAARGIDSPAKAEARA